jgi:hypothetical protein
MGREVHRLSARRVQSLSDPGRYADGDGLYLVVDAAGAKRWVMLYRLAGRRRETELGPLGRIGLAAARERAAEARSLLADGVDPIEARQAAPTESLAPVTFG